MDLQSAANLPPFPASPCILSSHAYAPYAGKFALVQNPIIYQLLGPLDPLLKFYTRSEMVSDLM